MDADKILSAFIRVHPRPNNLKPYLDGKIDLATAVHRLVTDYGVAK